MKIEELFPHLNEEDIAKFDALDLDYTEESLLVELVDGGCYQEDINEILEYKHIEQEGGGEGGAEDCHTVFKVKGKFFRVDYSYYSHYGSNYDNIVNSLTEVFPKEVTVTVYTPE